MSDELGLSSAVRSGDLLFCSGQIGVTSSGTVPQSPDEQFALAFAALGQVLKSHGCGPIDIVDLTSFHVRFPAHMDDFMKQKSRFLGGAKPAWTAIGVTALGYPDSLVEIKAIARLPAPANR